MSDSPSIFILGATGYIGGSILSSLLKAYPKADFVVQYRKDADKDVLTKFSPQIKTIKATLQDTSIISDESAKADVVINAADCDDLPSIQACIEGLEKGAKARTEHKKLKAVYLHTSGTGELCDPDVPLGELDPTVYDDADLKQIMAMPETRDHRVMTNKVVEAIERGHFLGAIVLPSTIYGPGTGPLNRISQQIPNLIDNALRANQVQYVFPGKNIWNHVHIGRLAALYTSLLQLFLSTSAPPPPKNGFEHYVFATNSDGPHAWKEVAEKIGKILKDLGELESAEAVGKKGVRVTGTNSVGKSSNAKKLVGWQDDEKLDDWLETDVKDVVKRFRAGKSEVKENWGN